MRKLILLIAVMAVSFILMGATCTSNLPTSVQEPIKNAVCGDTAAKIAEATRKFNEMTALDAWLATLPYGQWIPVVRAGIASALAVYDQLRQGLCVTPEQLAAADQVLIENKALARRLGKQVVFDKGLYKVVPK